MMKNATEASRSLPHKEINGHREGPQINITDKEANVGFSHFVWFGRYETDFYQGQVHIALCDI